METTSQKNETLHAVNRRLDEVSRLEQTSASISENGNQSEIIPTETSGRGGVKSTAKVRKFFENTTLLPKVAAFIHKIQNSEDITSENFNRELTVMVGQQIRDQHTHYIRFQMPDSTSIYLRMSDHSTHARNSIGKKNADKKISVVILVDNSPNVKFKPSKKVKMIEYVYNHPEKEQLINIAKSVFYLIDTGDYVDLAGAAEINVSPVDNTIIDIP